MNLIDSNFSDRHNFIKVLLISHKFKFIINGLAIDYWKDCLNYVMIFIL